MFAPYDWKTSTPDTSKAECGSSVSWSLRGCCCSGILRFQGFVLLLQLHGSTVFDGDTAIPENRGPHKKGPFFWRYHTMPYYKSHQELFTSRRQRCVAFGRLRPRPEGPTASVIRSGNRKGAKQNTTRGGLAVVRELPRRTYETD